MAHDNDKSEVFPSLAPVCIQTPTLVLGRMNECCCSPIPSSVFTLAWQFHFQTLPLTLGLFNIYSGWSVRIQLRSSVCLALLTPLPLQHRFTESSTLNEFTEGLRLSRGPKMGSSIGLPTQPLLSKVHHSVITPGKRSALKNYFGLQEWGGGTNHKLVTRECQAYSGVGFQQMDQRSSLQGRWEKFTNTLRFIQFRKGIIVCKLWVVLRDRKVFT